MHKSSAYTCHATITQHSELSRKHDLLLLACDTARDWTCDVHNIARRGDIETDIDADPDPIHHLVIRDLTDTLPIVIGTIATRLACKAIIANLNLTPMHNKQGNHAVTRLSGGKDGVW